MRANTQCTAKEALDKRCGRGMDKTVGKRDIRRSVEGRRMDKTVGNRDIRRSVEERGMGRGTRGIQDGHHKDFRDLTRQGTFGKEGREFEGGRFGVY